MMYNIVIFYFMRFFMAFDGITVAALTKEFNDKLTGGYIQKIAQPETDELQLTIKNNRHKL